MNDFERFPFTPVARLRGDPLLRPLLPITLSRSDLSIRVSGLLDTGADVNVLPYVMGIQLGLVWENQPVVPRMSGNLARFEARGVLLNGTVGRFAPAQLAFAWVQLDDLPLIFGQLNFFAMFDVCFLQSSSLIEVRPKTTDNQT